MNEKEFNEFLDDISRDVEDTEAMLSEKGRKLLYKMYLLGKEHQKEEEADLLPF